MVPADAPVEQYSYTLFVPKTKEAEFSSCAERSAHASRASRCFESIEMLREHLFQPRSLRILDFEILICQFVVNLPSCITYTYIHIFNTQPEVSIYRCCRCRSFWTAWCKLDVRRPFVQLPDLDEHQKRILNLIQAILLASLHSSRILPELIRPNTSGSFHEFFKEFPISLPVQLLHLFFELVPMLLHSSNRRDHFRDHTDANYHMKRREKHVMCQLTGLFRQLSSNCRRALASVFVLLYQQLRQYLYFCTSQPVVAVTGQW